MPLKRTALFEIHQRAGARLVDFGCWEMPVQYDSIVEEHLNVRRSVGIFDISHMGEVTVNGPGAKDFLNRVLTNDISKLFPGQGQYTIMCNEQGGAIDDLYAYRTAAQDYLLVINASRIDDDMAWLESQLESAGGADVTMKNESDTLSAVAIQGPNSPPLLDLLFPGPSIVETFADRPSDLQKNDLGTFLFGSSEIRVSRTGYTGEDGFELIAPNELIVPLWEKALAMGADFGLKPIGLGARDTLRTEMCYPLYGHELNTDTTPIEAGIGFFVALDKGNFNGRDTLASQKADGPGRKLAAFKMTGKSAPPRPHYAVHADGKKIGETTSGTVSPSMNVGIGLAHVPAEYAKVEQEIEIEIRNRRYPAVVVRKPIYKKLA
ncbi:MAG: glycine cleavage system protein T [Verrucomicrobiales bacterium]|nr:glycine cleavage system protein T [Verrucomicrobiales bacterium]